MPPTPVSFSLSGRCAHLVTIPPGAKPAPAWLAEGRNDHIPPPTFAAALEPACLADDLAKTGTWLAEYNTPGYLAASRVDTIVDYEMASVAADYKAAKAYWPLRMYDLDRGLPGRRWGYFDGPTRGWYESWDPATKAMVSRRYGWMAGVFDFMVADLYPPSPDAAYADCTGFFASRMEACRIVAPDQKIIAAAGLFYNPANTQWRPVVLTEAHQGQVRRAAEDGGAAEETWWAYIDSPEVASMAQGVVDAVARPVAAEGGAGQ